MAQIDPSIALSIKPIQVESPLVHAARAAELQGAQQTQLMNMLKMKEFADESRNKNKMTQWLAGKPNLDEDINLNHLATQFGAQGLALAKQIDDRRKARGEADYRAAQITDLASQRAKRESDVNAAQREQAIRTISGFRTRADALDMLYTAQANKTISDEAAENIRRMMPYDEEGFGQFKKDLLATIASPDAIMGANKPVVVAQGGQLVSPTGDVLFSAEAKAPTDPEIVKEYKYATDPARGKDRFTGSLLDFKEAFARAGRPISTTQAAPTVTMVLDPNDSTRMLSIDAKTYRGGSLGSPGVIGVAGKEPTVGKKQEAKETAQNNASAIIAKLRQSYDRLDELGGITSTENRAGTNISARMGASPVGQTVGSFFGTKTQAERDKIEQTRPLLMTTIMQAMGLSAKQLDSNAELKLWLSSATDPTKSLEANREALNELERLLTGGGKGAGASAGAGAGAGGGLSPKDKQALDWANSNPKDPRAAKIKQRLGVK